MPQKQNIIINIKCSLSYLPAVTFVGCKKKQQQSDWEHKKIQQSWHRYTSQLSKGHNKREANNGS